MWVDPKLTLWFTTFRASFNQSDFIWGYADWKRPFEFKKFSLVLDLKKNSSHSPVRTNFEQNLKINLIRGVYSFCWNFVGARTSSVFSQKALVHFLCTFSCRIMSFLSLGWVVYGSSSGKREKSSKTSTPSNYNSLPAKLVDGKVQVLKFTGLSHCQMEFCFTTFLRVISIGVPSRLKHWKGIVTHCKSK